VNAFTYFEVNSWTFVHSMWRESCGKKRAHHLTLFYRQKNTIECQISRFTGLQTPIFTQVSDFGESLARSCSQSPAKQIKTTKWGWGRRGRH